MATNPKDVNPEILPGLTAQDCAAFAFVAKQAETPFNIITNVSDAEVAEWIADQRQRLGLAAVELDQQTNEEWAVNYLKNDAPPSIQGQGGELTVLALIAGVLKDKGISESNTLNLVNEYYNVDPVEPWDPVHCDPLWEFEELKTKIHNTYLYCVQTPPGGDTAEADFANAAAPPSFAKLRTLDVERDKAARKNWRKRIKEQKRRERAAQFKD